MNTQQKALAALIITAFLGGSTGVFVKTGVAVIPPATFSFLRFVVAVICLLPMLSFRGFDKRHLLPVTGVSLLLVGNILLFAFGIQETTAVLGGLLYMFTPVLVAFFSYVFYREVLSARKIFGLVLGMIGAVFLVVYPALHEVTQFSGTVKGNVLVFAAVISFSLYSALIKKYQQYYASQMITFIFGVVAAVSLIPFAVNENGVGLEWLSHLTPLAIFSLLFVGIGGGAVLYLMYQYAIKFGGALSASMMTFLQPIAGSLVAFLVLGERLTTHILIGSVPIFIGAWLATIQPRRLSKKHA